MLMSVNVKFREIINMMHLTLHASNSNSTFRIYVNKKILRVFILAYIV